MVQNSAHQWLCITPSDGFSPLEASRDDIRKWFVVQVLLLKSYLHHRGLNDVYTGGLGSFSLTLMLVFYLEVGVFC